MSRALLGTALILVAVACVDEEASSVAGRTGDTDDAGAQGGGKGDDGAESGGERAIEVNVDVDLNGGGAAMPESYRVIVTDDTGVVTALGCPSDTTDGLIACTETGVHLSGSAQPVSITVKAKGYAFTTHKFEGLQPEHDRVQMRLAVLEAFQKNALFATGFASSEESVAFEELAVSEQTELGPTSSLKFFIDGLDGTPTVYFQNTKQFTRHIDFVLLGLGLPMSASEFEAKTQGPERTAMVGTLIYRPELEIFAGDEGTKLSAPVSLEFFPSDGLSPAQALVAHRLLEERLQFLPLDGHRQRLIYVPASDRAERELLGDTASFVQSEAGFARLADLHAGVTEQILNPGSAYGTLRLFTPEQLAESVVSWRDIVVLTRLPNDVPLVGGTITEELQTPLAHVNLAARARGTPNLAVLSASKDPRILPFLDRLVHLEVKTSGFTLEEVTLDEAESYWASQTHDPLTLASDTEFTGLPSFDELGFSDSIRVGAKAANLAELHQLLGDRAPRGFAVPFSAFDAYMRGNMVTGDGCSSARVQCEADGRTSGLCDAADALCEAGAVAGDSLYELLERLRANAAFASDTAMRETSLAGFRVLVENGEISPALASALEARTAEFFGSGTVRLRSSTNAEDLAGFNGAGLYDSVSAEATGARAVSSRIREVWASTWTFAAFEERSLWNITESDVRMGVAVNQAFGEEAVNGVLITENLASPGSPGYYVNAQLGELSVTNPENGATPEVLSLVPVSDDGWETVRLRYSSESPDSPLLTGDELQTLAAVAAQVHSHFAALYEVTPQRCALDLEFKFLSPDRALVVKQVRPYSVK